MYCKRIHRKTVYVRSWGWGIALHHHDDISWGYLKKRGYGNISTEKMTWSRFWKAFKPAILPLLLPIIIIGGIRIGVFTATEAGAVAIIYAAFLGLLYKEMHIKDMIQGLKRLPAQQRPLC